MDDPIERIRAMQAQHKREAPAEPTAVRVSIPSRTFACDPAQREREDQWQTGLARYREAALPKRHRDAVPDMLASIEREPGSAFSEAFRSASEAVGLGESVVLIGVRGTGKTQLAVTIAHQWCMKQQRSALYRRFADLFGEFKSNVYGDGEGEFSWMRRHARLGLLILDEAQESYGSDTESRILTRVFDHRYAAGLSTILIANLTRDAMAEKLGPSIVSRLKESGRTIECNWTSFRGATA